MDVKKYIKKKLQTLLFGTDFTLDDYVYVEPERKEKRLNIKRTIMPDKQYTLNEVFHNANLELTRRNAKKNNK